MDLNLFMELPARAGNKLPEVTNQSLIYNLKSTRTQGRFVHRLMGQSLRLPAVLLEEETDEALLVY